MRLFQIPFVSFAVPAFSMLLVSHVVSAPITTVPWNGKTGAVSFTYDDARTSQIPYLIPQLDSLGVKATFFISIQNIGNFNARRAEWIQAARSGHELTNHTYGHENVNGSDGAAVTTMIKLMADTLRGVDTAVKSLTFAYPNCNLTANATAKNGVNAENFIARGCATTNYTWGTQPSDWMNIQGMILGPTSSSSAVTQINTAKTNNRWFVTILHDVTPTSPDQYSMTPANNRTMVQAAVTAGVWIDTYERIASYYRAHFTIDTAKAVVNGNGWKVEWVSPHARLPQRVLLRVKLDKTVFGDSAVVVQNGVEIPLQSDTAYVVDFMKLRMDVYPKGTVAVTPASRFRNAALEAKISGRVLRLRGLPAGNYIVAVHGVTGALADQGRLRATGAPEQAVSLRTTPRPGRYQITLTPTNRGVGGTARKLSVLVLP
jgi:peptidoglycan/xylan/chitin deacetylase (PgdA/CDA1 family)